MCIASARLCGTCGEHLCFLAPSTDSGCDHPDYPSCSWFTNTTCDDATWKTQKYCRKQHCSVLIIFTNMLNYVKMIDKANCCLCTFRFAMITIIWVQVMLISTIIFKIMLITILGHFTRYIPKFECQLSNFATYIPLCTASWISGMLSPTCRPLQTATGGECPLLPLMPQTTTHLVGSS